MKPTSLPPEIKAPHATTIDEVMAAMDEQRIVTFDTKAMMADHYIGNGLSYWRDTYGDALINRHTYRPDYRDQLLDFLSRFKDDDIVDIRSLPHPERRALSLLPGSPFQRDPVPLREMIDLLEEKYSDLGDVDTSFSRARATAAEIRESIERQRAFGVFNTRDTNIEWHFHPEFDRWRQIYNWLWVGLSFGALHADEFDNMLVQLNGRKCVLMYEKGLSDLISDGEHYIRRFPARFPLSPEARESHRCMSFCPFYRIVLEPGMGVTIPAGAYHAPLALTYDSVSLASFVRPYLNHEVRKPMPLLRNVTLEATELAYRFAGLKLVKAGPYDIY